MRRIWLGLGLAAVAGALVGCGDEDPVSVGSDLLGEGFRTFEVVLDTETFLQGDTTYDRLGSLNDVAFYLAAADFAGEMNAHTLFRLNEPTTATYEDEDGNTQTDSIASFGGARLTLVIDTLSEPVGPIAVEVLALTESWDRGTATWELRYDTAGVAEPWTQPGGTTTGAVLGTATWESGDTLVIPIDSADAAVWQDSLGAYRGGLVRLATPDTRLRFESVSFEFDVVAAEAPEAEATAGGVRAAVPVATPDTIPLSPEELRVGGVPAWRSLLHFRSLAELSVPCDDGTGGCTVALSDVTVNLASLILTPLPVGGRRIEQPVRLVGRAVLEGPSVPLTRSPLSNPLGRMTDSLTAAAFTTTGEPVVARVPITDYIRRNIDPPEDGPPLLWLALTAEAE
ncbi:MAG: hypothetical protein GWM90_07225, partial [Gemmatimonadetes bacterium]|nr:hypothetical protein [Gemmatimonadota bacterium]NIQ53617.1 hypothetical protein [Gemmatimonadota bacterium]NIU73779.1 hypothetical protein [Gammaproteobacteria bacterium]NIX43906.1 hypothetical protein [Gemmatimonadota bacterium]NIY08124.1 hypothetical protein [Gemmatimonadota bacterium]